MAPEGELLEEVGDGFANRGKARLDVAIRLHARDPARQPQRLGQTVVQINLDDPLRAGIRQRRVAALDGAEGVEAHRHGDRAGAVAGKDLAHEIEQQIHFELQTDDVGRVR